MCDSIYYPSLSGYEDVRWLQNKYFTNFDITSIVDSLENGEINRAVDHNDISDTLISDLNLFEKWLYSTFYPGIFNVKDVYKLTKISSQLLELSKKLTKLHGLIPNENKKKKHYNYNCESCDRGIGSVNKDFYSIIEDHRHIPSYFSNEEETVNDVMELPLEKSSSVASSLIKKFSSISLTCDQSQMNKDTYKNPKKEIFYPKELIEKVNKCQALNILSVQCYKPNNYLCLVCNIVYKKDPLFIHLQGRKHQERIRSSFYIEKLNSYHSLFSTHNLFSHQSFFSLGKLIKTLVCNVCEAPVQEANIWQHVLGSKHRLKLLDEEFHQYFLYEDAICSITKKMKKNKKKNNNNKIKSNSKKSEQNYDLRSKSKTENQEFLSDNVILSDEDDLETEEDEESLRSTKNIIKLMTLPPNKISPESSSKMTLQEQLKKEIFYPQYIAKRVSFTQYLNMLTVQCYKPNGYICLPCNMNFDTEKKVFDHVETLEHIEQISTLFYLDKLNSYHLLFSNPNLFNHQGFFSPGTLIKSIACKVCQTSVAESNVQEHVLGSRHRTELACEKFENYHFHSQIINNFDKEKKAYERDLNEKKKNIEKQQSTDSDNTNKNGETSSVKSGICYSVEKSSSSGSASVSSSKNMSYNHSSNAESLNDVSCLPSTSNQIIDKLSLIYLPELMEQVDTLQNDYLRTVQCYHELGYRCLLCNVDYEEKIVLLAHLLTDGHNTKLRKDKNVGKLVAYYNLFSKSENKIHQLHFVPCNVSKSVLCKLCSMPIKNKHILEHVKSIQHCYKVTTNKNIVNYYFHTEMLEFVKKCNHLNLDKYKDDKKEVPENTVPKETKQHNVIKSFIKNPKTLFEKLENRFCGHLKYMKRNDSSINCLPCNVYFPASIVDLKNHIISNKHLKTTGKDRPKGRYSFYCDVCFKIEYSEAKWIEHMENLAHIQKVNVINQGPLKGGPYLEHECSTCLKIIYGNTISIGKHNKELVSRSYKKKKEFVLSKKLEKMLKDEELLAEKIAKLSAESDKALELHDLNWKCCKAIEQVIMQVYPACRAYPFGSRVSGLGSADSDLDVFVDTGMMYDGMLYQDAESQAEMVKTTTKLLKKYSAFSDINPIPQARTPIIQVFHKDTNIDCDVSFRHGLSVENTEFLRLCIDIQPSLKPLILILKFWMHQTSFQKITTYALAMMTIFFFQVKNFLPSVKKIREIDPTPSRIIAGWETFRFTRPFSVLLNVVKVCNLTTKELMIEFFKYYSNFDYDKLVVCPLLGHTILKTDFDEKSLNLPKEMKSYIEKIQGDENSERFRYLSPMCIQDPFDLSHNLTKACPIDHTTGFSILCLKSHNILTGKE